MSNNDAIPQLTVDAAVQGAQLAGTTVPIMLGPATVISYSESPPARCIIRPDTSNTEVPAKNLLNQPLFPGIRVMVGWGPDGQCLILNPIGRVPFPGALLTRGADMNVADNTATTLTYDATRQLLGGVTLSGGYVQLPFTGMWAASTTVSWNALNGTTQQSRLKQVRIERCGRDGALIEIVAMEQRHAVTPGVQNTGYEAMSIGTVAWPCNAGDQLRVILFQQSPNYGFGNEPLTFSVDWANFAVQWVGMSDDVVT